MARLIAFLRRLLPAIFAMPPSQMPQPWPGPSVPPNADELLGETNGQRIAHGVAPLAYSPKLQAAAAGHARSMAVHGRLTHGNLSDGDFTDRLRLIGYAGPAAENIGEGQRDASTIVMDWMNSTGHRSNMLNPRYTEFGGVVAYSPSDGTPFWCAIYGSPRP